MAGLTDAPTLTEHAGEGHGMQVYLTPLGARRLFGMPMSELTRQVVALEDVIGGDELSERLATAPDWPMRLTLLEREIARRTLSAPPLAGELEWIWQQLHHSVYNEQAHFNRD